MSTTTSELIPIEGIEDNGTRRTVIYSTNQAISRSQAEYLHNQWNLLYVDWNEPPKLLIVDGGSITVIEDERS